MGNPNRFFVVKYGTHWHRSTRPSLLVVNLARFGLAFLSDPFSLFRATTVPLVGTVFAALGPIVAGARIVVRAGSPYLPPVGCDNAKVPPAP